MIGNRLIHIHELDSTNNYAAKLLSEGNLTHGTVILADYQTAGRGQRGNSWQTIGSKQFTASYFLETHFLGVEHLCYLNMCIALSVYDGVSTMYASDLTIKWPNDLFVRNKKIGGILIETNWNNGKVEGAIVGIGINLNPIHHVKHAISLQELVHKEIDSLVLLDALSNALQQHYLLLKSGDFDTIKQAFEQRLWKKDKVIRMIDKSSLDEFDGIIRGVDIVGNILIESEGLVQVYSNQEVDFSLNYDGN